jgi:hypothetical protein
MYSNPDKSLQTNDVMKDFFLKHELKYNNDNVVRIIVGETPYKQKLNSKKLAVSPNNSSPKIYQDIGNIAFLVNNWIKIQDSIEMIFNLLFGTENSIQAIADLKYLKISAEIFASELYNRTKTVFINRYIDDRDKKDKIIKFIKSPDLKDFDIFLLFVGQKAFNDFGKLPRKVKKAIAIHPSGVNLNHENRQKSYTDCWIKCVNDSLQERDDGFMLNKFRIFT